MRVGSWFVGVGAYFGLMLGLGLAMWLAGRLAARVLGVKQFRWFREPELPTPPWRLVAVRVVAALAPYGVSVALFWLSLATAGVVAPPTTQVEVFPDGGASRGGMVTGDRVLSIGGKSVKTWEALRAAVPQEDEPVPIQLERAGKQLELQVTPRRGRIGVAPFYVRESVGLVDALGRAAGMPWRVAQESLTSLMRMARQEQKADLRGPVGIIRETSRAESSGGLLEFLAVLASYFSLFFAGVPLVDQLTSWLFRWRHPGESVALRQQQLARCRQALLVSGSALFASGMLLSLSGLGAPPLVLAVIPCTICWAALFPVIWSGGSLLWGRGALVLLMGASTLVPCASLFVAIALYRELGSALSESVGGRTP